MEKFELTSVDLDGLRIDSPDHLCKMAELMGYKAFVDQMRCRNGAYVSSLLAFFEDNPGAIEAVYEWVTEQYADKIAINDQQALEELEQEAQERQDDQL